MGAIWPGALLAVYLTATLILLFIGHARVRSGGIVLHAALLAAVVAATWLPVVPRWLRAWTPLLALLTLYAEMPMLIRAAGGTVYFDDTVVRWEQQLFGTQPAMMWARDLPSLAISEPLHLAYVSYYAIIFATPLILYFAGRDAEFSEAVFTVMLTFVVCFVAYIAFPVAGPRYRWPTLQNGALGGGPIRHYTTWLLEARSSRGTAFPSSHVAVSVAQSFLAVRYFGRRGLIVAAVTLPLALGAIYGGFHYAVDVLAGTAVGIVCTFAALALHRRARVESGVQANAIAPT